MASLHELERAVAAGIYEADPAAAAHVRAGRFPAERHLQVYRHNVFESLTGALKAVYPVVERLVGEGFFRYAAEAYIRRHPPTGGNLHDFGGGFAAFLAGFAPAAALVYLPDVARLEWAWHEAFHAADAAALPLDRFADVPSARYGELRFTLHPSARLVESEYPILRIWQVNQPDRAGDETVDLAEGGVRLLVIRRGLEVQIEALGPGEHALLAALAARQPFAACAEAALEAEPGFDLAGRLRWHVEHATLTGFTVDA